MNLRTRIILTLGLLAFTPAAALAQPSINWSTIDCGGGQLAGSTYRINGTIGQPDATSTLTGGTFSITGGYWPVAPCPADFNNSGVVTSQDLFDFLAAWFAHAPSADFNGSGVVTSQDLFDFLAAWFAKC